MIVTRQGVYAALANLNSWQARRVVELCNESIDDGIAPSTMLALMVKETNCQNIVGGGVFQRQPDGKVRCVSRCGEDRGALQINVVYHGEFLSNIPGCPSGSWKPERGRNAAEIGYVPQLSPQISYGIALRAGSIQFAIRNGVRQGERVRFSISAHNAGNGGALEGYRRGDVDMFTTGGDYSAVTLEIRRYVQEWLREKGLAQ